MEKVRLGINGFGRIGRAAFKVAFAKKTIEIVAINDLTDSATLAHLLRYDTVYGRYDKKVLYDKNNLIISGKKISVYARPEPRRIPWDRHRVDVVIESTGRFVTEEGAREHFRGGARKVIISAPSKGGNVPTYLRGVNDKAYSPQHTLINNASCTTNNAAPVLAILDAKFGVERALMTTIHGYTQDQNLHDGPHRDLRRARAAALNIVPTTTGAAIATTEAIPALKGHFDGIALRVPIAVGSLSDFTVITKHNVTEEQVKNAFIAASKNALYRGVVEVTSDPIVSSDIIGSRASAVVDLSFIKVVGGNMVKILAWYDNEYGYANRLVEMVERVGRL